MSVTLIRRDNGESLTLDASPEQNHSPSVAWTDHPVADSAAVTDHAERQPRPITVEGIITASPFVAEGEAPPDDPIEQAVRWLHEAAVYPMRLETSLDGTYDPVGLERYPYTVDQVRNREFSLSFKQVRIAEAATVRIPPRKEPTLESADDKGLQTLKNTGPYDSLADPTDDYISPQQKAQRSDFPYPRP